MLSSNALKKLENEIGHYEVQDLPMHAKDVFDEGASSVL